jgi:hypothetical protein
MEVQDGEPSMKHGKPYEAFADGKCEAHPEKRVHEARPVGREDMQRLLDELDKQIEMEMAVYSGMEYIAGKTEKD